MLTGSVRLQGETGRKAVDFVRPATNPAPPNPRTTALLAVSPEYKRINSLYVQIPNVSWHSTTRNAYLTLPRS